MEKEKKQEWQSRADVRLNVKQRGRRKVGEGSVLCGAHHVVLSIDIW